MIAVGDIVMFSRKFCQSCGLYTSNDPLVNRRLGGLVKSITPSGIATVEDTEGNIRKVRVTNLARTDALEP